jgi:type VI secretion system protein ImpC
VAVFSAQELNMSYMSVESRISGKQNRSSHSSEFSVVILGDFSGRASRGLTGPLSRLVPVDRDNFFELFSAFDIKLKLPFDEQPIEFKDFEHLHPDYLLDQLAIFAKFRQWQRKALKPEHFEGLLEELRAAKVWNDQTASAQVQAGATPSADKADNNVDFLLEQVLNQGVEASAQTDVEQLIRSIVAPYATLKADIRLSEVQNAINQAMAQTLRSILHHGHFHNLEATWRSVYFFVRRIASDNGIKIWLLDISEAELAQKSEGEPTQSALYDLLVKQRQAAGQSGHNLIINLFSVDNSLNSLPWLTNLAAIAAANNGACVGAANPNIAGCSNLIGMPDPTQWQAVAEEFGSAWQAFRTHTDAAHMALTAPRFLLRTPYGKKSSPIEAFDFTEMIADGNHQHYLWGSSAVLVGVVLVELWLNGGGVINSAAASQIDQLPIHVEKTAAGEQLIPSAEIVILDSTVAALREAGLLVVRSIYNKNAVLIPLLNSCAANGTLLFSR